MSVQLQNRESSLYVGKAYTFIFIILNQTWTHLHAQQEANICNAPLVIVGTQLFLFSQIVVRHVHHALEGTFGLFHHSGIGCLVFTMMYLVALK